MASPANNLLALARHLFFDHSLPGDWSAEGLADQAPRHRAEPLLFLAAQSPAAPPALRGLGMQQRAHYLRNTSENAFRIKHAIVLADALEAEGIPCICYRGPFSGLNLYEDFATRPFQDVDLIIPDRQSNAAWKVSQQLGYHLLQPFMPRGFFRRHHIHWAIVKGPSLIDLHWAVEHPYTLYKIDYDALFEHAVQVEGQGHRWTQPCPEHLFILSCLQLTKHEPRALDLASSEQAGEHLLREHLLWKWLDIALMLHRHGDQLDSERLVETATAWRALDNVAAGCRGAETMFGISPAPALMDRLKDAGARLTASAYSPESERSGMASRLGQAMFQLGGFRPGRIADTARFLLPPGDYFAPRRGPLRLLARTRHLCRGLARLAVAGFDLVFTMPVAEVRRRWHDHQLTRKHRMIARRTSS